MEITFLESACSTPLTKSFSLDKAGNLEKTSYPLVSRFTSHTETINTLSDMAPLLRSYAQKFHCLLKGSLTRPLAGESRKGTTDPHQDTEWVCFDLDGVKGITSAAQFVKLLPPEFQGVDYITQLSSSMGVDPSKGFSAHLFFLLDRPVAPQLLKEYLKSLNFSIPILRTNFRLSRTKNTLKWPLDITVCQNDKLIYIAPPILGAGVTDSLKGPRIKLTKKKARTVSVDLSQVNPEKNHTASDEMLNELRTAEGLPKRSTVTKIAHSIEVLAKPGKAVVTGIKSKDEFTYLNLNGGDSWGYYHYINDPTILFNFKGEPNYLLKEIAPDYYLQAEKQARLHKQSAPPPAIPLPGQGKGRYYLAIRDKMTDTYFNGWYDYAADALDLHPVASKERMADFLAQYNEVLPEPIPDWEHVFQFDSDVVFDPNNQTLNMYSRSSYLRKAQKLTPVPKVPQTINKIIFNAVGSDTQCYEHFLNWLACIIQHRQPTHTAWTWNGVQGTGKGVLFNKVMKPILGERYVEVVQIHELEDQFNDWMERCVLVLVDEAEVGTSRQASRIMEKLKNYITEPNISIRRMRAGRYSAKNWLNFIFASNKHEVVQIDPTDRRFNVAPYQSQPLRLSDYEIDDVLPGELQDFTNYLYSRTADASLASKPLKNAARAQMQVLSRSAADEVGDAIRDGDFEFFVCQLPTDADLRTHDIQFSMRSAEYRKVLRDIFTAYQASPGPMNVSRDQLQALFSYNVDKLPATPNKFTAFAKHHGVITKRLSINGRKVHGITVDWNIPSNLIQQWKKELEVADATSDIGNVVPLRTK